MRHVGLGPKPLSRPALLRFTVRMSESAQLPMNFGGIDDEGLSGFENARVVVWPVSYEGTVSYGGGTGEGAMAVVDASRNMELYDEETDAEVYRLGIHTTEVTRP